MAVLDPDIVLHEDGGDHPGASVVVRGARAVAERALMFSQLPLHGRRALVNGAAGAVVVTGDRPFAVLGSAVIGGKIVQIHVLSDPARLSEIDLSGLD